MDASENKILADLLIPKQIPSWDEVISRYPQRNLPQNAEVVRVAPSPTGFAHFGFVFASIINEHIARKSNGIFIFRIEDTDKKREVVGGIQKLVDALNNFEVHYDEGVVSETEEKGNYGPYIQSHRQDIYLSAIRHLISAGNAYPCFCSAEELATKREQQKLAKVRPGYHGEWATCRHLSLEQIKNNLEQKKSFVIRFRTPENPQPLKFHDSVKGNLTVPANDLDYVILKANLGLPVYHLAAMVDDHLSRVTQVLRGEEWLASLPVHLQIISAFGWNPPKIGHFSPIMKMDGPTSKRKLSKRKDPEADTQYYVKKGIPAVAVRSYIMRLASSKYEDWRTSHPQDNILDFPFSLQDMTHAAGALFDNAKFSDICKNEIANYSAGSIYDQASSWAKEYDPDFYHLLTSNPDYSHRILSIERTGDKKRKDLSCWSDVPDMFGYFYDDVYKNLTITPQSEHITDNTDVQKVIIAFLTYYHSDDDKDTWLEKMRRICTDLGYAGNMKDYKANPENFKGHLGDIAMIIRTALSGRTQTPDLYEMLQTMGEQRVRDRLQKFVD